MWRAFGLLALLVYGQQGYAQTFVYVEPGNRRCPVVVPPPPAPPKTVQSAVAVAGAIRVSCGFAEGSYTVILSSTDPNATFSPKTFLVNFGSLAGSGAFAVTFATPGEQKIFATITSNMGSPILQGKFTSFTDTVTVKP
jgi:hypothetical protein